MSHFTVMVIGENPEEQLAPFDESIEMEKYMADDVSEKERDNFINHYYKKSDLYSDESEEETPLNWDVFEKLNEDFGHDWNGNRWEKGENGIWAEYSTYNPKSKWDWYVLGGRWSGEIKLKEGGEGAKGRPGVFDNEVGIDQAYKRDIANLDEIIPFAVLKNGEWYERGKMGWWAVVSNEKDDEVWYEEVKKIVNELPDNTLISIYDCHI